MPAQPWSKLLRRIHLYLALFLTPWVLLYALSTLVMNHKQRPATPPSWELLNERVYDGVFSATATPKEIAAQLLASLELEGAHRISQTKEGLIQIQRLTATAPLRITYESATRKVKVEKQVVTPSAWLETMHRRRGFQHPYFIDDAWAASVDLFIVGVLFWSLSGLWLWWELKATRIVGAIVLAAGISLFAYFLRVL